MKNHEFEDLTVYLKAINGKDVRLSKEEELMHIQQAKEGDKDSLNILISSNIKYIVSIAKRHAGCGVPLVDLVQEGVINLMHAIDKYSSQAHNNLRTYASAWIQKGITDAIANNGRTVRLPMHKEFERYMDQKNGKEVANIREVRLDNQINEDSKNTLADLMMKTDHDTVQSQEQEALRERVEGILSILEEREREVIKAYFGIDYEYEMPGIRIAELFGLSQVRVSQIVTKSIDLMKAEVAR